ncbi:MAG: hemerythrin family protein [Firmicutes bacterium]|nr:hemerythrin family protein [Bacillota bacterium]
MEWNSSLETGNSMVDTQHKELFALVKKMLDAGIAGDLSSEKRKEKIENAIDFLGDYAKKHFADEERLMAECDYPEKAQHKALHEGFIPVFQGLRERLLAEGSSLPVAMEVNKVLVNWLIQHIMGTDKKFADYYKNSKA